MDAVSCYVALHAWGLIHFDGPYPLEYYVRVVINGMVVMNDPARGILISVVDPRSCGVNDTKHFDTHSDPQASPNLVNYLQNLPIGRRPMSAFSQAMMLSNLLEPVY